MTAPMLRVDQVSIAFGGLKAVADFRLTLPARSLQGLIGPNGAGKTTVFNLLTGVYQPHTGTVELDGTRLNGKKPHQIARAGMARTFQNIRLFANLSVLDNVRVACAMRARAHTLAALLRTPGYLAEERALAERAMELLAVFDLQKRASEVAKNLPYGDQRRLEMARALAVEPKVLLLDEPAAGMNPQEKHALRDLIRQVQDRFGLTVLLIEHDMGLVMDICDRITVLDHGVIIAEGVPRQVQENPAVIQAYLGTSADDSPAIAAPEH
jgi:branched-chain amino acid transport system ATP-binding protein